MRLNAIRSKIRNEKEKQKKLIVWFLNCELRIDCFEVWYRLAFFNVSFKFRNESFLALLFKLLWIFIKRICDYFEPCKATRENIHNKLFNSKKNDMDLKFKKKSNYCLNQMKVSNQFAWISFVFPIISPNFSMVFFFFG